MIYLQFLLILLGCAAEVQLEQCVTPYNEDGLCVYLHTCKALFEPVMQNKVSDALIEKYLCGGSKVCCGSSTNFSLTNKVNSTVEKIDNVNNTSLLPSRRYCGYQHSDDYFREDNDTSVRITEFPWLAHLQFKSKTSGKEDFKCSGSLINNKFILTAAHCLTGTTDFELIGVRLGEYHLSNQTDCIQEPPFDQECSDVRDYGIEKVIPHPNYNKTNFSGDIALVKLNRKVEYSDYIRPICLPQSGTISAEVGDVLTSSGWGLTNTGRRKQIKKKSLTRMISNRDCSGIYSTVIKLSISTNQFCSFALNNNTDVQCAYDSGGPLMLSHHLQWHQVGVLSAGPKICGLSKYPDVSTRVANYIGWIEANLEH